jgi:pilus assembly protein Flp/PilA
VDGAAEAGGMASPTRQDISILVIINGWGEVKQMLNRIKELFKDEEGATMVEYALMVALIAVVLVTVVTEIGRRTNVAFTKVQSAMPAQ